MSDSENDMATRDAFAVRQHNAAHMPRAVASRFDIQIVHAMLKAIVAAKAFDGGTQTLHHLHQTERADMRLGGGQDFFRRTGLHEFGQNLAAEKTRILDLAVELAVGKR